MNKNTLATFLYLIFITPAGAATPDENHQYVWNELAAETTQCWCYYAVVGDCASKDDSPVAKQLAERNLKINDTLLDLIFEESKEAGMSDAARDDRVKMCLQDMANAIGGSCLNLSILVDKYARSCKVLAVHPDVRLSELKEANPF
jgi:hypothetical protein